MTPRQQEYAWKREQAIELWRDRWTAPEIAEILEVSKVTVRKWAQAAGLQRPKGWHARHTLAQVQAAYRKHGTYAAAAAALGLTMQAVHQRLTR